MMRYCTRKAIPKSCNVKDLFPILQWAPNYTLNKLKYDIIGGMTLGMMIMPSSIAYANLSGLPAEYGLYTALTPGIIYAIFGTSKDMSVGPSVNMAMFIGRYVPTHEPLQASMLTFLVGGILIFMAIFKLGVISSFIPKHVMDGFVTGIVLKFFIIQLPILFGYKTNASSVYDHIISFVKNVRSSNGWDISMMSFCFVYLAIFLWIAEKGFCLPKVRDSPTKLIFKRFLWFLCILRSPLVCIMSAIFVYVMTSCDYHHAITLSENIPRGFPKIQFPFQSITTSENITTTPWQSIESFGSGLIVLPLIQLIQAIAVGKTFGKINNYKVNITNEIAGLGIANIVNSFFGGWLVCGGFGRSAVNSACKCKTPLSGAISCLVVILGVSVLTPAFEFIPKATLSAMLMMAVIKMCDLREPYFIWKFNRIDIIPYTLAFAGTVYRLEWGVILGSLASLLILSYRQLTPQFSMIECGDGHIKLSFEKTPTYPCVEKLKEMVITELPADSTRVEVSLANVDIIDFPSAIALKQCFDEMRRKDVRIEFVDVKNKRIVQWFTPSNESIEPRDETISRDKKSSSIENCENDINAKSDNNDECIFIDDLADNDTVTLKEKFISP